MPARRDFHTGRPTFLHRGWGPLEPFDDSLPETLKAAGVQCHLASDHYHYWEDGGSNYHTRYSTWEFIRGQEGDPWIGQVGDPRIPPNLNGKSKRQDWVNRPFTDTVETHPLNQTFAAGLRYIERNSQDDNWFLQIECFDPHEPFVCADASGTPSSEDLTNPLFDWPGYTSVSETPDQIEQVRGSYAALLEMCDRQLGLVLDAMDRLNLWDDTMLILWTDHGYLLGEHNCWAKNWMPLYEEVSHTPFFVWDPRSGVRGERRSSLVQPSIDLAPTLLNYFGVESRGDVIGKDLADVVARDARTRDSAVFGYHGDRINVTDGQYVLYDAPADPAAPVYSYTLVAGATRGDATLEALANAHSGPVFSFTKGLRPLQIPAVATTAVTAEGDDESLLFDLAADPEQLRPIVDPETKDRLRKQMAKIMREADAPAEAFDRMALSGPVWT